MNPRRNRRWAPLALALAAGCAAPDNAPRSTAQSVISDELHNAGIAGFLFLPPMVPRPAQVGDFVPDAQPTVRIDEITPTGVTLRTLATFTATSGPNRERLRVHLQNSPCDPDDDDGDDDPTGYFLARWNTQNASLSASATYRVRVLVPTAAGGQRELGFADVDVVRTEREFRSVDRAQFAPLLNGRVLRIKFRIDRPAVDGDRDGVFDWRDNCPTTANADQRDTDRDGRGDACECVGVTCRASDACHVAGACDPRSGACANASAPDGTACAIQGASGACRAGVCVRIACAAGRGDCDGDAANGCESALDDAANCGRCGAACAAASHAAAVCAAGTCGLACEAGYADCDGDAANGCEQDVATDAAQCGACGRACADGRTCVGGACTATVCAPGRANCDGAEGNGCEVTLAGDVNHCGACGRACALPGASAGCADGTCRVVACTTGRADCDGDAANGCEVTLATDANHCGACGRVCSLPHAGAVCAAGACAVGTCAAGFADCDGVAANGCEVELAASATNCGACGTVCSASHADVACAAGACAVRACAAGWADCDGNVANGCEADLTATTSCGACGAICPAGANGSPRCAGGACALACAAGFADCDGLRSNGCEADLGAASSCGACGNSCSNGRTCQAGRCTAAVCAAGTGNCDGVEDNGCEVTLASDAHHCGACGRACSVAHATGECAAGVCGFSVCDTGYGDCDGSATNGCEVALASDTTHCGGCGVVCAPGRACDQGHCVTDACVAGHVDLDGDPTNGCEYACTPRATSDPLDGTFVDENCDGVDGDRAALVYVSPTGGSNSACGLDPSTPCASISLGIARAAATGRRGVLVAAGTFPEVVTLVSGIGVYGGYDPRFSAAGGTTLVTGGPSGGLDVVVVARSLTGVTTVSGLTLRGPTPTVAGASSYGVYVIDSVGLRIERTEILGGAGAEGRSGANAANASSSPATAGNSGGAGARYDTSCDDTNFGGAGGGGNNVSCTGVTRGGNGGNGGTMDTQCATFSLDLRARPGASGATGGDAAPGGSGGATCGGSASLAGTSGSTLHGIGGSGAASARGRLVGDVWVGARATSGGLGRDGGGGGGGGGAGGCDAGVDAYGAGGGGGGAGGCRASTVGEGGFGGGGSFGVFALRSSLALYATTVSAGVAGRGGDGGAGGRGQPGGAGGAGGAATETTPAGGAGGRGGDGGHSGGGGGGAGGVSACAFLFQSTLDASGMGCVSASPAPGGNGGASPGNPGTAGVAGLSLEQFVCAMTSGC